jgi:hypothetical protein
MSSTVYNVGVKIEGSAAGLAKAAKEAQAHIKQMGAGMGKEFTKMAQARETLGVRSEHAIQREIQRTEAAYNRLARSGRLSFNEQRRAAQATRDEVTRLNNEMGKLTKHQQAQQRAMRGLTFGAGVVGAGALIAPTVKKTMDYDLRLAYLANTGYSERNKAGRLAGRNELDAKVSRAVAYGGGTRDSALDTLEQLLGAGIFKPEQIGMLLDESTKAGTANNVGAAAFAEMAIKANKSMGIGPEQAKRMFGIATFAGQQGGFEIKDMAKHLPAQMALAKPVGMYGEQGFAKLAALNQAAITTAGTRDEAGNNVVNLLAKMGSMDTAKDFKKLGIDLPRKLAEGRMKGIDALDVVGNLLDEQLGKDKNFQQVQKELAAAKNDVERAEKLKAVGDIAQGTVVGKVFQDRQALLALLGFINDRQRVNQIAKDGPANADAVDKNFEMVSGTASYKSNQAAQARDIAYQKTMDKMLPALGGVADGLTSLMTQYPGYTTAIAAATAAVAGLGGAAALAAVALRGGVGLPAGTGTGAGAAAASSASKAGGFLGRMGKLLGPAGILFALEGVSDEDIARLRALDAKKGLNDPRLTGSVSPAALEQSLRATEVKGEIFVRVTAAPGLQAETSMTSSSPRIPMKAALGQTNLAAGH